VFSVRWELNAVLFRWTSDFKGLNAPVYAGEHKMFPCFAREKLLFLSISQNIAPENPKKD
jgi:hypothetical protein